MNIEKASFITAVGAFITALIGSWDAAIITLIIFMAADWLTGLNRGRDIQKISEN